MPRTFDIESSRDMRNKLEREFERIQAAGSRENLSDHGVNFAVTAWHVTDWLSRPEPANSVFSSD
jgi:hypothetical protein